MKKLTFQFPMILLDFIFANLALYGGLLLRFEGNVPQVYFDAFIQYGWIQALIAVAVFWLLGMYTNIWKYASVYELWLLIVSVTVYGFIVWVFFMVVPASLPRSVYILLWILMLGMVGFSRLSVRAYGSWRLRKYSGKKVIHNILIIGAGQAASMVIKELSEHPQLGCPVAVIDDDESKRGFRIHGVPVVGGIDKLYAVVEKYHIDEILVAIPSAPETKIREILNLCKGTGCKLKRLPGLYSIIDGKATIEQVRNVNIADLLGRPEIKLSEESIAEYLTNQVVLVTGAGGSIGSELSRQIAAFNPKKLILFDIYENNLYNLSRELECIFPKVPKVTLIGSIRDANRLEDIFSRYHPDVVFHAAAHKHVPLMEDSPEEAIKNNIFGTINVAEASDKHNCKKFVLISTDKAVNPTNVMGASKRMAEIAIQHINKSSKTEFAAVRFGNVLGSNGSVIPIFQEQIAMGGPVTVTHPEITRYFMTISEAVQLVLQAGAMAVGGEIFVLDMGEPVKIDDLARDLIHLSGFKPDVDINIEYTGLRPGEKMYEELNLSDENVTRTSHEKIFVCKPIEDSSCLMAEIQGLADLIARHAVKDADKLLDGIIGRKKKLTS